MKRIVLPEDMKAWDRSRIIGGIPSETLMLRAAQGLKEAVMRLRSSEQTVTCICGSGNNGGDGFALAWLLQREEIPVRIVFVGREEKLTKDAAFYRELAKTATVLEDASWQPMENELLVDAIFGIGLDRPVTGRYADLIASMNASQKPILCADIPSGLDAKTGAVLGISVRATETVTMQFVKTGMLLGQGPAYSGRITVCPLAEEQPFAFSKDLFWQEPRDVETLLPPRPFDSHKGKNGHALLCVGSKQYIGAALLSSRAALRAGCGILSVCVPDAVRPAFAALPEAITVPTGTEDWDEAACTVAIRALEKKSAVGIGCGIGTGAIEPLLKVALKSGVPAVIDADGLNHMACNRDLLNLLHPNVVITPHPGEMARLLNGTVDEVLSDPLAAVHAFPCITLLKGATTIVSDGSKTVFCTEGTPGLAKGGSGDVLTGIITGLLSQGLNPFDAARAGTYLLGTCAKEAYRLLGQRMLLASDVIEALSEAL
ncbi:MAG: NAD(P)H-hydrate dehydratase [Clostridia bacterium]|nr:NAD(P)H-hydrate dehydratase [Clostridia bacterium]